ncbi:MAG: CBS domain-containing protein [Chloroflexota bacterium]|jgi:Zn-dependent protease/predicted transcriptional regulator
MLRNSVRLITIGDIEIGVHYSWLLVFFLVAWTLAVGFFPFQLPGLSAGIYWIMGFVASLLLFVSVLIHELAHSFTAEARGLRVSSITLFIFGGVSNISGEPRTARDELLISIVGPISSLILGGLFWILWAALGAGMGAVEGVLIYLATINILLAIFNLIPGFPLDGGRVLRAIVWWSTNSFQRATQVAVISGHVVAFLFIIGGLLLAFSGAFLSGIWLILIGWFLNGAADAAGRQTRETEWFRGVTVRQVMNPQPVTVDPDENLSELVFEHVLLRGVRALPVVEDGELLGMVTLSDVRGVDRDRWDVTTVRSIMARPDQLQTVSPQQELTDAIRLLAEYDINQLPVVDEGKLVGLLSRSNVIRFLQIKEELGLAAGEEEQRRAA